MRQFSQGNLQLRIILSSRRPKAARVLVLSPRQHCHRFCTQQQEDMTTHREKMTCRINRILPPLHRSRWSPWGNPWAAGSERPGTGSDAPAASLIHTHRKPMSAQASDDGSLRETMEHNVCVTACMCVCYLLVLKRHCHSSFVNIFYESLHDSQILASANQTQHSKACTYPLWVSSTSIAIVFTDCPSVKSGHNLNTGDPFVTPS